MSVRRLFAMLCLLLFFPLPGRAANNQPINTLPGPTSSQAIYQQFLNQEDASRCKEQKLGNFVQSGGKHATSGTRTSAAFSTVAYTKDCKRISQPAAAINYQTTGGAAANDTCWTVASLITADTFNDFHRVAGTSYFVDCTSALRPTLPDDAVYLMRVVISSSAITRVETLFDGSAFDSNTKWVSIPPEAVDAGNTVDVAQYFQDACDRLAERNEVGTTVPAQSVLFIPAGEYLINTPVSCNLPDNTVVRADGAIFNSTEDIMMFDLNPDADPDDPNGADPTISTGTQVLQVNWFGGWFVNTASTFAASGAITIHRCRNCSFNFMRFTGFHAALTYGGADTYNFNHLFGHNNYYGILQDNWDQTIAGTIDQTFFNVEWNTNMALSRTPQCALCFFGDYYNVKIIGGSSNGGSKNAALANYYFTNPYSPRHILIMGTHFEGGGSTDSPHEEHPDVWFRDTKNGSPGFTNVLIQGCSFAQTAVTAIRMGRAQGITVTNSFFAQNTSSGGHSIYAPADDNERIYLSATNRHANAVPEIWRGALRCIDTDSEQLADPEVASAQTITLPTVCANSMNVTGTTAVRTINGTHVGHIVTLRMGAGASIENAGAGALIGPGNVALAGPFAVVSTPGEIALQWEPNNYWQELWRGVNTRSNYALTVSDSGNGSHATGTLDTDAHIAYVTCNDADGCDITLGETYARHDQELIVNNISDNPIYIGYAANVQITNGLATLRVVKDQPLTFVYMFYSGGGQKWVAKNAPFVENDASAVDVITLTSTQFTVTQTVNALYHVHGNQVTLHIPQISGTASGTTFTITGLPAYLTPGRDQYYTFRGMDNTVDGFRLMKLTASSTTISLFADAAAAAWTNGGTKRLYATTITYTTK